MGRFKLLLALQFNFLRKLRFLSLFSFIALKQLVPFLLVILLYQLHPPFHTFNPSNKRVPLGLELLDLLLLGLQLLLLLLDEVQLQQEDLLEAGGLTGGPGADADADPAAGPERALPEALPSALAARQAAGRGGGGGGGGGGSRRAEARTAAV